MDGDGVSLREKAGRLLQTTGRTPDTLRDLPELPEHAAHVWRWFHDLHHSRTSNGFGPNPIPYAEIDAWARLTGTHPKPWEVNALKRMDLIYLEVNAAKPKE